MVKEIQIFCPTESLEKKIKMFKKAVILNFPGYRNITLRNVNNQCIGPASLFVLFDVHYFSTQRGD